jgi:hypothetical protein
MKRHILVIGIIFLLIIVGFQPAFANNNSLSVGKALQQPLNKTFMKTFGGTGGDGGSCVQQTSDGGYILIGYTRSFGAVVMVMFG